MQFSDNRESGMWHNSDRYCISWIQRQRDTAWVISMAEMHIIVKVIVSTQDNHIFTHKPQPLISKEKNANQS